MGNNEREEKREDTEMRTSLYNIAMRNGRREAWLAAAGLAITLQCAAGAATADPWSVLTPWNFNDYVGGGKNILAIFHAPWCGGCKKFMPDFEKAAHEMKYLEKHATSPLTVMKADVTEFEYEELKGKLNVSKVPAVKLFKRRSSVPLTIEPAEPMSFQFSIKEKLGLPVPNKCMFGDSDAQDLSEKNFESVVMDPKQSVLVQFYAPWCPHCQRFKHTYNIIARKSASINGVKVVRVNSDNSKPLLKKYGVKLLPHLMIFSKNNKTGTHYKLPEAQESLEMVDKIMQRLKQRESSPALEADAKAMVAAAQQLEKDGKVVEAIAAIEDRRGALNVTTVWQSSVTGVLRDLKEREAMRLKEEASSLLDQGKHAGALHALERIVNTYGDSHVAKSEAVENLLHNCRSMAKQGAASK